MQRLLAPDALGIFLLILLAAGALVSLACTPAALLQQREAQKRLQEAHLVERRTTGAEQARATRCREAAARAELLARESYPALTPEARAAAQEMRSACRELVSAPAAPPPPAPASPPAVDAGLSAHDVGPSDGGAHHG